MSPRRRPRWAASVDYPVIAVGDLHGQSGRLLRLLERVEAAWPEWTDAALVFLGDFVDRGPDVRGALDLVLDLADDRRPPVTAVLGNHDLALVRAAGLGGSPSPAYWVERYRTHYDCEATFRSYLGRDLRRDDPDGWPDDLDTLRAAMPARHAEALADLPWLVEAPGHLFLHNGLSPELEQGAEAQVEALRARRWDGAVSPRPGTDTERSWQPHYPVWIGADRRISAAPLPMPGRVQVTGHMQVAAPDVDPVRIRIDTSGGAPRRPLTACLLRGPGAAPEFVDAA